MSKVHPRKSEAEEACVAALKRVQEALGELVRRGTSARAVASVGLGVLQELTSEEFCGPSEARR